MFDLESGTLFVIPDDLVNQVPCQTQTNLYTDNALDIDIDDDEWVRLSRDEQYGRLTAKQAAEARAVAACGTCPLLDQCRTWALGMGENVFGVAGGLTYEERSGNPAQEIVFDPTTRGPLGQVRDDLIERWAAAGLSNKTIAERLGCNVRTVERRKAGLANGNTRRFDAGTTKTRTAETADLSAIASSTTSAAATADNRETAAYNDLLPARISEETAAIYDALIDGGLRDRSDIVAAAVPYVDRKTALATAPSDRTYEDEDAQATVGARKFLMNRVDIAVRRGRIQSLKTEAGKVLICLEPNTASAWREYRGVSEAVSA
jgi:hypothetical protein